MATSELKQYIDKVLGNSIRCLLPSYWWKRLFYRMADTIDNVVPIVDTLEDLNRLDAPMGKVATVIKVGDPKSFSECYQPTLDDEAELAKMTRIRHITVTSAPMTTEVVILLFDNVARNAFYLGILDGSAIGAIYNIDTNQGNTYTFTSSSGVIESAVATFNKLLKASSPLYLGPDDEPLTEEQWTQLDAVFAWLDDAPGGYIKGRNQWERLARADEVAAPSTSTGMSITVDEEMSASSTNPVQNKVVKQYIDNLTETVGNTSHLYLTPGNITLRIGKGYVTDSAYNPISAGNVVISSIEYDSSYRDRIVVFGGATSLVVPSDVVWENGAVPTIDPEVTYALNIKSSYGVNGGLIHMASLRAYSDKVMGSGNSNAELSFIFAVDSNLNDTTTTEEKSANIANANSYYQGVQNGNEYQIDLKVFLRDTSANIPIKVYPSFIGIAGGYNGVYQSRYGANAMVFAKLDLGDRYGRLTFDLILDPDSGFELVPHVDMHEINILHARFKSGAITSEGLTNLQLMQNRTLYNYALSAPIALYVTENHELIPARVSQASGFLAVYAGDYTIEFYDDGTVKAH